MVGIGYKKDFAKQFSETNILKPDFIEVAPENWVGIGGYWKREFRKVLERYPLFCHGLSLSLGSPEGIDSQFVRQVKQFLDDTQARFYSDHLSFSKVDNAHLYDLLPIPFTEEAIKNVVQSIKQVQDIIGKRMGIENVSYYTTLEGEMSESEFLNEIVRQADCELLLDVNNVYVNAHNHSYDAQKFIDSLPLDKVRYIHMAGHLKVNKRLIIDTHGSPIISPVYELLAYTLAKLGREVPILLERDFNIPTLEELQSEIEQLQQIQREHAHEN